jgi:hypothetical protein
MAIQTRNCTLSSHSKGYIEMVELSLEIKWLVDLVKETYDKSNEILDRNFKERGVSDLTEHYLTKLYESIRYLSLPHMSNPKSLGEMFVKLHAIKSAKKWKLTSEVGEEQEYDITKLFLEFKHIMILGEPGAGKTTFVRRIAYAICTNNNSSFFGTHHTLFPLLIECRNPILGQSFLEYEERMHEIKNARKNFVSDSRTTHEYAREKFPDPSNPLIICLGNILKVYGFPYSETFVTKLLRSQRCVLFLDGLDEALQKYRAEIVRSLGEIRNINPNIYIILTCRSAEATNVPNGFNIFEIAPIGPEQRREFVLKWFNSREDKACDFLSKIENSTLSDIADRPLLLTLLCALFETANDLPRYKIEVYRECVELALRRWDAYRDVKRKSLFEDLSFNQRILVFSRLGATLISRHVNEIASDSLIELIKYIMEEMGIQGKSSDLVSELITHTGLIMEVSMNHCAFSHKSIQEYFAALHYSQSDPNYPAQRLIEDRHWLVTTEMTASLMYDAFKIFDNLLNISDHTRYERALSDCVQILFENPISVSHKGQEKIIGKLFNRVSQYNKYISNVIVIFPGRFRRYDASGFDQNRYIVREIRKYDLNIYVYYKIINEKELEKFVDLVILSSAILAKLCVSSPSALFNYLTKSLVPWQRSLLTSVMINNDPRLRNKAIRDYVLLHNKDLYNNFEPL